MFKIIEIFKKIITLDNVAIAVLSTCMAAMFFTLSVTIMAVTVVTVSGIGFIICIFYGKKQKLGKPHFLVYVWAIVYLVRIIWAFAIDGTDNRTRWLELCLPMVLFPAIFQYYRMNDNIIKWTLSLFVRFCFLYCLITIGCIVYYCVTDSISMVEWMKNVKVYAHMKALSWTPYRHPSYIAMTYLLALPAGLYLRQKYCNISRMELLLLGTMQIIVIIATGARMGVLMFLVLLFIMVMYRVNKAKRLYVAISFAGFIVMSVFLMYRTDKNLLNRFFNDPIRQDCYNVAFTSIKTHPYFGIGAGEARITMKYSYIVDKYGFVPGAMPHPHNQYIGEIMNFGIIGAIPFYAVFIYMLVLAFRQKNMLLLSIIVLSSMMMLSEQPFDYGQGLPVIMLFLCLFWAIGENINLKITRLPHLTPFK